MVLVLRLHFLAFICLGHNLEKLSLMSQKLSITLCQPEYQPLGKQHLNVRISEKDLLYFPAVFKESLICK